jgi:hypothetical protein
MLRLLQILTAWGMLGLAIAQVYRMFTEGTAHAKRLHQIPCADCQYFSGNYTLKCALHPHRAGTEEAIDCRDFERFVSAPVTK